MKNNLLNCTINILLALKESLKIYTALGEQEYYLYNRPIDTVITSHRVALLLVKNYKVNFLEFFQVRYSFQITDASHGGFRTEEFLCGLIDLV
mgnify:CR=1 FL=1